MININSVKTSIEYLINCILAILIVYLLVLIVQLHASINKTGVPEMANYLDQNGRIDLSILSTVESSANPKAKNHYANGVMQIGRPALADYNKAHDTSFKWSGLRNPALSYKVGDWYVNKYIPARLEARNIPDTRRNRLWAYRAGAGALDKQLNKNGWSKWNTEIQNYPNKYGERSGSDGKWYSNGVSKEQGNMIHWLQTKENTMRESRGEDPVSYPSYKINLGKGKGFKMSKPIKSGLYRDDNGVLEPGASKYDTGTKKVRIPSKESNGLDVSSVSHEPMPVSSFKDDINELKMV